MRTFKEWWRSADIFCGDGGMEAAEQAWEAATEATAKRCQQIAQQHYLSINQAVAIDEQITKDFSIQARRERKE